MTDVFDEHLLQAQDRYNPHTLENAVHQLTDYAQLKNDAQAARAAHNTPDAASITESDTPAVDDNESLDASAHTDESIGDANPNHGYESDGDVEMVDERDSIDEITAQTDFSEAHPDKEALTHRHRDAESILNARMSSNHSHSTTTDENEDTVDRQDSNPSTWQDGLRRDESDNA